MQNVVLDSNVWYDLGSKTLRIKDIKKTEHRFLVSPLSIYEIVSGIHKKGEFQKRINALEAIGKYADKTIVDPEAYLYSVCYGSQLPKPFDAIKISRIFSKAKSVEEFDQGMIFKGFRYHPDLIYIHNWRKKHMEIFSNQC